jgi:hypothetical protein
LQWSFEPQLKHPENLLACPFLLVRLVLFVLVISPIVLASSTVVVVVFAVFVSMIVLVSNFGSAS